MYRITENSTRNNTTHNGFNDSLTNANDNLIGENLTPTDQQLIKIKVKDGSH